MAEEQRQETRKTKVVKEALLKAGWLEDELRPILDWFAGPVSLQHPDAEEL